MTGISIAARKAKGRKLQQWVRNQLIDVLGINEEDVRSCPMGSSGEDLIMSPAARELAPYTIEAKHQETAKPIYDWYAQAMKYATDAIEPIVVCKRNHHKPLVLVDAEHFFKLINQLNNADK